jgi:hypothetical protein
MSQALPGRLGTIGMDGELPRREDLGVIFDELDYQLACQAFYGPLEPYFDRSWKLGDITAVDHG